MPKTTLMELRNVESSSMLARPIVCPAGEPLVETLEGPACHCRIEDSVVSVARDVSSFAIYCTGAHELCPTWRAAREAEWEHRGVETLTAADGPRRTFSLDDVQEVEERRAVGDAQGARELWRKVEERRREQGLRDVERE